MTSVQKFKLLICIVAVIVFTVACYTGSSSLRYETQNKTLHYERDRTDSEGQSGSLRYETPDRTLHYERNCTDKDSLAVTEEPNNG